MCTCIWRGIKAQEVEGNSAGWREILRKWSSQEKENTTDFLTSVLKNRWLLAAEFPPQTEQDEALESVTQTLDLTLSLLLVLLLFLSSVGFSTKT